MKFSNFLLFLWVNSALLDTDPDSESGSTDLTESVSGTQLETCCTTLTQQKIRGKTHPILGIHIVQIPGTVRKHLVHHHLSAALPGHGKLSAIPPGNNWQAFCNTAQQQLASYLQDRPATIGKLSAIPPSNNWQAICNTAQHTIGNLSAIPSSNNWQAIWNTAEQQLASYLQYRPATIGKLSAIPPSNNWQPRRNSGNTAGQCSGSVTFWCGSSDPNLIITDPEADPYPRFSVLG